MWGMGSLRVQRWQCKVCHGSASPLPPDVTARQCPQTFRELVADLHVHSVSFGTGLWVPGWML